MGADLVVGSLIKNPGGGLAPTGGYIAGRRDLVEGAAMRLTGPGIGGECGCTLGQNRLLYQGLLPGPPHGGPGGEDRRLRRRRAWSCWATRREPALLPPSATTSSR